GHDDLPGLEQLLAVLYAIRFQQRVADLVSLGDKEGETHAAPDQQLIGPLQQRLDDTELVADLRSAKNDDERPLGFGQKAAEDFNFFGQQPAGGTWETSGGPHDGGVGPVGGAERVIH